MATYEIQAIKAIRDDLRCSLPEAIRTFELLSVFANMPGISGSSKIANAVKEVIGPSPVTWGQAIALVHEDLGCCDIVKAKIIVDLLSGVYNPASKILEAVKQVIASAMPTD